MDPRGFLHSLGVLLGALTALCVPAILAEGAPYPMRGINVVAAESFYGNIAAQLGGENVNVTSILSDPKGDARQYEFSREDANAVAAADLVIQNGGGYDDWMNRLLSESQDGPRVVLRGFDLAPTKLPDARVWYDVDDVQAIAQAMTASLEKMDPDHAQFYAKSMESFRGSLARVRQKILAMNERWRGTPVGMTETLFLYQAAPIGLTVLTPMQFQEAVAEGTEPPADAIALAENQVKNRKIKVLIYNEQTVSSVAVRLRDEALAAGIPVVQIVGALPSMLNYQDWMFSQLVSLDRALRD